MERREHIVSAYEEDLSSLNNKIAKMGGLAEPVGNRSKRWKSVTGRLRNGPSSWTRRIHRLEVEIENDARATNRSSANRWLTTCCRPWPRSGSQTLSASVTLVRTSQANACHGQ